MYAVHADPEAEPGTRDRNSLETQLVERFQRGLPMVPRPYAVMAKALSCTEETVMSVLEKMLASGHIARIGPVFRPNTIGVSTLAAMAVPTHRLETVAKLVNDHPEVNHNYQRDHRINLWFVVAAPDRGAVERVLEQIRADTGLEILNLPLEAQYHIDLSFSVRSPTRAALDPSRRVGLTQSGPGRVELDEAEARLVANIQSGLPLMSRPFQDIGERTGLSETQVIATMERWLDMGVVRRMGLVARHYELGYHANAMVVWDVPDRQVDATGRCLGQFECVTLCYRRPRRAGWPYNLFCMVHGRDHETVLGQIDELVQSCDVGHIPREVLFSVRRFKQTGAHYRTG